MKEVVRIAPSPTGKLHIGTIRTAYHNWIISKQNADSRLIVRIDDTDLKRSREELISPIFKGLDSLGLDYDETFKQSDRFHIYDGISREFVERGYAYVDDGCIRLKADNLTDFSCSWTDTITGEKNSNEDIDEYSKSQVIIKSDGSPAYNFASAVDDCLKEVTWIVRGVDHIPNTYKQVLIFRILSSIPYFIGKTTYIPKFTHVGLVCHKSGKKLSKRDSDDIDLSKYKTGAILNYVLRLGWSPKEDNKSNNIIDKEKAIRMLVGEGNFKSSNSKIDMNKLEWYNKKYQ